MGTNSPRWLLGVVFGTSNIAAAYADQASGQVQAVQLTDEDRVMPASAYVPSQVFTVSTTHVEVGAAAITAAGRDPVGFIATPKRMLSLGQTAFHVGEREVPAYLVLAAMLRAVVERAQESHAGEPPAGLVLAHPESWTAEQVQVYTDAAAEIGYTGSLVRMVTEPCAAAHHFARRGPVEVGGRIAVVDLGGSTLDVTVLEAAADGTFRTVATQSDDALGGRNFDAAIRLWVDARLGERNPELLRDLPAGGSVRELRDSIRAAKEALATAPHAEIVATAGARREVLTLTRVEFNQLIETDVARVVELAHNAIAATGARISYLTGGSARVAQVRHRLEELGPVVTVDDPETVGARGALVAATRQESNPQPAAAAATPEAAMPPTVAGVTSEFAAQAYQTGAPSMPPSAPIPQVAFVEPEVVSSKRRIAVLAGVGLVAGMAVLVGALLFLGGNGKSDAPVSSPRQTPMSGPSEQPAGPAPSRGPAPGQHAGGSDGAFQKLIDALPSDQLKREVQQCISQQKQHIEDKGGYPSAPAGGIRCRLFDQHSVVYLDQDAVSTLRKWRDPETRIDGEAFVRYEGQDGSYEVQYLDVRSGLHLRVAGFGSRAKVQSFLNEAGL